MKTTRQEISVCAMIFFVFTLVFSVCAQAKTITAPRYYLMQVFVVGIGMAVLMTLYKPQLTMWLAAVAVIYGAHSAAVFYEDLVVKDRSADSEYHKRPPYITYSNTFF